MPLRKREEGINVGDVKRQAGEFCPLAQIWPAVAEFLSLTAWPEGGGERTPGKLMLFFQDSYHKVMLVDLDADEVAFWSGTSVAEVLDRVEADLIAGRGDWRKQKAPTRRGKN